MMIGDLLLETIKKLMFSALSRGVLDSIKEWGQRRRITNAVERSVIEVVEPLASFLEHENISQEQQMLLVEAAERELGTLVAEPARLFSGSLDGEQIFRQLYADRPLPQTIREERLVGVYELLLPRIANVLCKLLPVIDEWKLEAWRNNYQRLDEIAEQLRQVLSRLDADAAQVSQEADTLLTRVRRGIAQRETFRMDLTALRSDAVISCGFHALFIHPALVEQGEIVEGRERRIVSLESRVPGQFLAPSARSVVMGGAGAGKSTWLRWLERAGSEAGWSGIVVRSELRELIRRDPLPSWQEALRVAAGTHLADEINTPIAQGWRDGGRLAFLIDGFDEIPADRRTEVKRWLIGLSDSVRSCPIVLTSRPLTTDHLSVLGDRWSRWQIDRFDQERIVLYIQRWYENAELPSGVSRIVDATALAQAWSKDPTIKPLTGSPLLLATLLLVHVLDGSLPAGRAKLYQRYVDGMLGVWDHRQKRLPPKVNLTPQQKREILRDLALRMFLDDVDQIEEQAISSLVGDILSRLKLQAEPADVLDVLMERTGLLVGPGVYAFSHKSVAEFLVAEAIVDGTARDADGERVDRMRLFRHRYDDRWNVVTFLWAGLAPTIEFERFVEDLLEEGDQQDAWKLVFGLLHDQFARADGALWERCVRKFELFEVSPCEGHSFITISEELGSLPAPSFRLRGIESDIRSFEVLQRAWIQGGLRFLCDSHPAAPNNAGLRWLLATMYPEGEHWLKSLQVPSNWPEEGEQIWAIVAIGWATEDILGLPADLREQRLLEISSVWPQWREGIVFIMADIASAKSMGANTLIPTYSLLAKIEPDDIPQSWGSRWGNSPFTFNTLLAQLEKAVSLNVLPDDETSRRAFANLHSLCERFR